jgi:hypothetical protein
MKTFRVGDKVKWVSQAQGSPVKKVGFIVEAVQAHMNPKTSELDNCGQARIGDSYVVRVPGKTPRARAAFYWPVASLLKLAKATELPGKSRVRPFWRRDA